MIIPILTFEQLAELEKEKRLNSFLQEIMKPEMQEKLSKNAVKVQLSKENFI